MRKMNHSIWTTTFLMFVAAGGIARADFETPIVIQHARIIPSPGEEIEQGSILIDHGRIAAVGADITVPRDTEIFDATDLIVYSGFIDANTHAGFTLEEPDAGELKRIGDEIPKLSEGVHAATIEAFRRRIHPHWRVVDRYSPEAAKRDGFRQAGLTVALVSPPTAIIAGRSAVIALGDAPLRRSVLVPEFAQHAAMMTQRGRRPFGDTSGGLRYPTTTMGAMAAFRQILSDARWQRDLIAWYSRHPRGERPPVDRDLEVLWDVLDGEMPVAFFANRENEIHRALDMAKEFDLTPIIVGAREGWKVADRLKSEEVPVILSLKWSDEPEKSKPIKQQAAPEAEANTPTWLDRSPVFDKDWQAQPFEPRKLYEERVRLWGEEVDNALRLHEAGVRFAIGSFELKSAREVWKRLHKAIERGLPEAAALAALTRDAAGLLDLAPDLGEIAPGRMANLTLMDKPLADEKAKVKWVFVEGKAFRTDAAEKKDKSKDDESSESGEDAPPAEDPSTTQPVSSQPTTEPVSQPTTAADDWEDWPDFECEIKADRKPRFSTGGSLLIKNATLLTITDGDLVETDLLIEEGRITAIGGDLTPPPDMPTIDLRGYCVMPGMIDPHSHLCSEGGLNEGSLSVTPEVRVRDVVDHTRVSAFRALAGGVTTVHTMHGSANTIGGQNVVLHLKYGRPAAEWRFNEAPQTIKFALGENVKQSNFVRRGTRFPRSRMGVEAVLRRSFDAARQYLADWETYIIEKTAGRDPRPLRHDLRLAALSAVYDGDIWVHCHCYRADEVLRLLKVAEDYGFRIGVLQHILEGYRVIPEMHRHGCAASTFSDWWAYKIEAYNAIPQNAARMVQGGVVATVNSDSGEVVRHLNLEAAKSMRFGDLEPNDALRLVTLNAAIQLGIDKHVGSIEVGKSADLAVFDGHPLDTLSKCVLTLIDGEVFFQHESLDIESPPMPLAAKAFAPPRSPLPVEASKTGEYWLVGGTIHPISGPTISDGVLVIQQGKIARVAARSDGTPTKGTTVVDVRGLNIYPGLINAGIQLGLTEIDSVAGSVDTRDLARFQPDLMSVSAYNPFASSVEVTRAEGVTSIMLPPGGGVVEGRAGLVHLDGWSMPEALIESSVGLSVALPSLPARFPDRVTEEDREKRRKEYAETMAEVEAYFRKARHYADVSALAKDQTESAPEFDCKLEAMIPAIRGEAPIFFRANGYKGIREALRFAKRFSLRPVIFGGREAWKLVDELALKQVDVILVRSMAYPGSEFEPWDSVYRNAAVLHRAGVRICFATSDPTLAKQLGIEAGMAAAHGLEPLHAIRALTLDAANILGVGDKLGSLEPGKIADVILTTDSPLQASNRVVAAFIGGRPIDLSSKHSRTDDKFRYRPEPRLSPPPELRGPPPMWLKSGQ